MHLHTRQTILHIYVPPLPTIGTFDCEAFDEGYGKYLKTDFSIDCVSGIHKSMEAYAGFMVLVYPLGVPFLYFTLLYNGREYIRNRDNPDNTIVANSFSTLTTMLWSEYDPCCWWWEVFECGRRLMLTGVLVFIKPGSISQIAWALLMSVLACTMSAFWCPYVDNRDDFVAILASIVLVVNLIAAILIKTDVVGEDKYNLPPDGTDGYNQETFDWLLLMFNLLVLGAAVVVVIIQFRSPLPDKEEKKTQNNVDGEGDSDVATGHDERFFQYTNPVAGLELVDIEMAKEEAKQGNDARVVVYQGKKKAVTPILECELY